MKKLIVKSDEQIAELWDENRLLKSYVISTAANGLGCENDSYCTPHGKLKVAEKIGDGYPLGTIFKSRIPTGEIWNHQLIASTNDDLILTRILWLEGTEDKNLNTLGRYVYLHGTNHEDKLGRPVSHGCIRFSNSDIIEIYEQLDVGAEVIVE
jgi:hypothetical protein